MSGLFQSKESFNGNINSWDVRNVTNMSSMFYNAKSFNQPLDNWNVSNVKNMKNMFADAKSFNQPLDNWNVSNVTNMEGMFMRASKFNQPLNNWDVSNVKNMKDMFSSAVSFNPDFSPNFLKIKFKNAIKEIQMMQRKKCIDENHYKSLQDRKILDFIEKYKLNHYCLKESNGFVDVRPKNHLHFEPKELVNLTRRGKTFG